MMAGFEGILVQPPVMMAQLFEDVGGFLTGSQVLAALGELLAAILRSFALLLFPVTGGA